AALEGRLATLTELAGRPGREPDFLPLLVAQNVARVRTWEPERVLPDIFPRAALAAAVIAASLLAATLELAPTLNPPPVAVARGRLVDGVARLDGSHARATGEAPAAIATSSEDAGGLLRLPAALQERI